MSRLLEPRPDGWAEVGWSALLAALYAALLAGTLGELGYARDEGFYFVAARVYESWFELLATDAGEALRRVDEHFRVNREHPPLVKMLFALCHHYLFERWGLVAAEGTSFRLGGIALSSLGVGVVHLWGVRSLGRLGGIVAAASLAFMPRFFFHAHLACFDAPVVAMWTLAAYAYVRAFERGGAVRVAWAGLAFGLALGTKHNAWFLPVVCTLHALVVVARAERSRRHADLARALSIGVSMAVLGGLLWWLSWPWLWHDTFARLAGYVRFHLGHVYYNMEFLGENYFEPPMPRSYAFVMTAATVPAVTLVAFLLGLTQRARRGVERRIHVRLLWLLAIVVQYAAWLRATTPIFGGTKHWMTAYPFVALFAAAAVVGAVRAMRRRSRSRWAAWLLPVVALASPGVQALSAHPWGLTQYTPLVGGAPGAASLGLNRGFWGYTTGAVADVVDRLAPPDGRIFIHDTARPAWRMLQADGRIRSDLVAVPDVADADVALYHHELHMRGVEYQSWVAFDTVAPVYVAGLDGVPVIWIYARP